ncbi:MAG: glycosyltransferase [Dehalococcoidia bacterium]
MRIIHVTTRYHASGGAERNIAGWMREEVALGWEVVLVAGSLDTHFLPDGVEGVELPSLLRDVNPRQDARALLDLRRLLRARRPDVVHTHESKAGILGRFAALGCGAAIVHSVHILSFDAREHGRAKAQLFRALEVVAGRVTDHLVTVSDELRTLYLDAGVRPGDTAVIHSPIDVDAFLALRESPPPGPPETLAMIGALEPRKQHAEAIRALAPLLRSGDTRLVIAGEGAERPRLEGLIDRLRLRDRVTLLGYANAVEVLRGASMLVHTSRSEGLAQVVVQATAAGRPVVATPMPGLAVFGEAVRTVELAALPLAIRASRAAAPPMVPPAFFDRWREPVISGQRRALLQRLSPISSAPPAPAPRG